MALTPSWTYKLVLPTPFLNNLRIFVSLGARGRVSRRGDGESEWECSPISGLRIPQSGPMRRLFCRAQTTPLLAKKNVTIRNTGVFSASSLEFSGIRSPAIFWDTPSVCCRNVNEPTVALRIAVRRADGNHLMGRGTACTIRHLESEYILVTQVVKHTLIHCGMNDFKSHQRSIRDGHAGHVYKTG